MHYLTAYNQSAVIRFPLVTRNSVDLAVKATFTPANGDVNISKDGGAQANPANNLNIVAGTTWNVTLSAAELTAKEVQLMVRNNTAVEDQWLTIRTFGNASAYYQADISAANLPADLKAIVGAAVSGPAQAGILDVNVKNFNNSVVNNQQAQVGAAVISFANNSIKDLAFDKTAGSFNALGIVDQGRAQNAAANNIQIRSAAGFACNEIVGGLVVITGGTGAGQTRPIIQYNGNTKVAIVDTWTTTPSGNIDYEIFAGPPAPASPPQVQVIDFTANALKEFFNLNTGTNFAQSVAGSVVNEIALNAGGSSAPTVDQMLNRFNSNLALGNQSFTLTGSVTGNVGNVTSNVGGSVAGSVGSVVNNVTVQAIANNAITAVSINANAITGAKVFNDVDIRNVNGNVSGTVAAVTNLNAQLVDAKISLTATPAQVKTQVVAALSTDTYAEPGQGTPGATTDLSTKIGYLFKFARNKVVQNSNQLSIYSNNGGAVDHKATVSDDGNNFTRGELATGP